MFEQLSVREKKRLLRHAYRPMPRAPGKRGGGGGGRQEWTQAEMELLGKASDEETARVLIDGSYWTGDLGRVDGEGNLYIVDRRKDMIITGGENVYGVEVEDALTSHPAVFEAAVIGTPDERWGELVVGIVVVADDVSLDELDRHCRARLAAYKIPRRYVLRSEPLPRSAAGKLLKRELREELGELQDSYPTQG